MRQRTILLCLLLMAALLMSARKWVVTDDALTVWSTPDYIGELGKLHCDDVIEEIDIDGGHIKFNYNGQIGYVSSNCCKVMEEEEADVVNTEKGVVHVAEIEGSRYQMIGDKATTIWSADAEMRKLGRLWKNDEIDVEEFSPDGRFAFFTYKGEKAKVQAQYFKQIPIAMDAEGAPVPAKIYSEKPKTEANYPMLILAIVLFLIVVIPIGIISIGAWVNLIYYVFAYQRLRRFYNNRAGADFMPPTRLSKMLLKGLIPLAILAVGSYGGIYVLGQIDGSLADFGGVIGLILMLLYIFCFAIPHRARTVGKRQARWETLYPIVTLAVLIPVAIWLFNVMLFLLFAIPLCIFILNYVLPGAFSGAAGSSVSDSGLKPADSTGRSCAGCGRLGDYSCPHFKEDGTPNSTCSSWIPR